MTPPPFLNWIWCLYTCYWNFQHVKKLFRYSLLLFTSILFKYCLKPIIWKKNNICKTILGRKRPKRVGSRQLEQCSAEKILMDISHPCCERNCLQDLTFEFVSETRTEFWKLVICYQNSLVCNHRATVLPEERCVLAGCLVCSECWRVVHGISKSRYDNCNLLSEAYEFHLLIFTSEVILGSYRYIQLFS